MNRDGSSGGSSRWLQGELDCVVQLLLTPAPDGQVQQGASALASLQVVPALALSPNSLACQKLAGWMGYPLRLDPVCVLYL